MGYPINHHFRQRHVQPFQLLAYEFPLRFNEPPPDFALEGFKTFFLDAIAAPMLVNERQQSSQRLPPTPAPAF